MRSLVVGLVVISGCFWEMRGSTGTPRHAVQDNAEVGVEGDIAFGAGYIDKEQAALVEMGIGGGPLGERGSAGNGPDIAVVGVRYEHAIGTPLVRAYGRAMWGFNACQTSNSGSDASCQDEASRRDISVTTLGAGLALTLAEDKHDREIVGSMASVGLGVVYQKIDDALLGRATVVGVELSVLMGGDLLTAFGKAARKHD